MKFNELTNKELYAIIVKDENGIKRCVANICGAILVLSLPRDIYSSAKVNDIYRGKVNVIKRFMLHPEYVGKGTGIRTYDPTKDDAETREKKAQSVRQHVDAYLVRIKHDLYDRGFRAGTHDWNIEIRSATALYNAVNDTNWEPSKDASFWYE